MGKCEIRRRVLGRLGTNCYLIMNKESRQVIIIDPAAQADVLIHELDALDAVPAAIFLTHGHFDHIGAVAELAGHYQIPVCAGRREADLLADVNKNLSLSFGSPISLKAERFFEDMENFELAGINFRVYHTPGHTEGGVCYLLPDEHVLFSGDTIFRESVGRSDLPTGSMSELIRAIKRVLAQIDDDTVIYPGHGDETTAAHEQSNNPFL